MTSDNLYTGLREGVGWATAAQLDVLLRMLAGGPLPTAVLVADLPALCAGCGAGGSRTAGHVAPQDVLATASVLGLAESSGGTWHLTSDTHAGRIALRRMLECVTLDPDLPADARELFDVLWTATGGDDA